MAATTIFLVTLFAAYYFDPLSRKVAARSFNKWPPLSTGVLLLVIGICCAFIVLSEVGPLKRMVFFGPFLLKTGLKSLVFTTVFSFYLWYRQKFNVVWLVTFIGVLLVTCVLAMVYSSRSARFAFHRRRTSFSGLLRARQALAAIEGTCRRDRSGDRPIRHQPHVLIYPPPWRSRSIGSNRPHDAPAGRETWRKTLV